MIQVQRVLREKRRLIVPLVVALVANVVLYVAVVFPLGRQAAAAGQAARDTRETLQRARLDFQAARAIVQGKQQADVALQKFYKDVLPPDPSTARRITYLRLAQLAREANVRLERGANDVKREKGSTLSRLTTSYTLAGDYGDVRRFIYSLETAPEFIVLDNVALSSQEQGQRGLAVVIDLATYFRSANGD